MAAAPFRPPLRWSLPHFLFLCLFPLLTRAFTHERKSAIWRSAPARWDSPSSLGHSLHQYMTPHNKISSKSARKLILFGTTEDLKAYFKQYAACRRDRFNQDGALFLCCCHCQPRGWTRQTRSLLLSRSHFFRDWRR